LHQIGHDGLAAQLIQGLVTHVRVGFEGLVLGGELVEEQTAGLGIDVPGELSVVGFDDSPAAAASRPGLTTVRQDQEVKGAAAVQLLFDAFDAIQAGQVPLSRRIVLPTELVIRGSTGPVRGGA